VRPAVVVQADFLNGLIDDTILVKITGRHFGIPERR
jgi:mRNA-degrading endonuclease toxin of MazEF toxin-antitoxin module